jgi:flagellar hook-associated protein 3 FlgL
MIQGLRPNDEKFLTAYNRILDRAECATRQVTSGLRVNAPSDDPDQVSNILTLRASLERASQIGRNLSRVQSETDIAEQSLGNAVTALESINTLGTQAATGTETADSRLAIADQVESLFGQLVQLANTSQEGRYIFHGDSDLTAPYTVDLTQANGVTVYDGAVCTREALHPSGTTFSYSRTAADIFDNAGAGKGVFLAVNNLRLAIQANDTASIQSAMEGLRSAQNHLNSELAYYGSVQKTVAAAIKSSSELETQYKTTLSDLQDADITEAILELSQAVTHRDAALAAQAKMPQTSLFDYLK